MEIHKINIGTGNTGDRNIGDNNTGYWNSGERNTGNNNSGAWNSGSGNTGDSNTGYWNSGERNSGNRNTGYWNTGCDNAGHYNAGNCNIGDYNTGDWNKSSSNVGCFMTVNSTITMFNKPSSWTFDDWRSSNACGIMDECPTNYTSSSWVMPSDMTDKEKEEHPEYKVVGGYLKVVEHKADKQRWWDNLPDSDKQDVMDLPNFDPDIFFECTGIRV